MSGRWRLVHGDGSEWTWDELDVLVNDMRARKGWSGEEEWSCLLLGIDELDRPLVHDDGQWWDVPEDVDMEVVWDG